MSIDRKKLALIHIIKKELGLSDNEYRNILQEAAGVMSAKELDEEKFRRLMNYFVRSKYYLVNPFGLTMRQKLYIKYLAQEMNWDEGHLNNFIRKYYHQSNVDKLTRKAAIKVIESLKNIKEHQNYQRKIVKCTKAEKAKKRKKSGNCFPSKAETVSHLIGKVGEVNLEEQ